MSNELRTSFIAPPMVEQSSMRSFIAPPMVEQQSMVSSSLYGIKYGLIISLVVLLLWWTWAAFIYRYSDERLSDIVLNKFTMNNPPQIDDKTQFFKVIHVLLKNNQINATIAIADKETQHVIRTINKAYNINSSDNCSIIDESCIVI